MKQKSVLRLYFEDHGQDFLWWDVETIVRFFTALPNDPTSLDRCRITGGPVIDCGPFQAWYWTKACITSRRLFVGGEPRLIFDSGRGARCLNYPLERIEVRSGQIAQRMKISAVEVASGSRKATERQPKRLHHVSPIATAAEA